MLKGQSFERDAIFPAVKTVHFQQQGAVGSIPCRINKIPLAVQPKQKKKKRCITTCLKVIIGGRNTVDARERDATALRVKFLSSPERVAYMV